MEVVSMARITKLRVEYRRWIGKYRFRLLFFDGLYTLLLHGLDLSLHAPYPSCYQTPLSYGEEPFSFAKAHSAAWQHVSNFSGKLAYLYLPFFQMALRSKNICFGSVASPIEYSGAVLSIIYDRLRATRP